MVVKDILYDVPCRMV